MKNELNETTQPLRLGWAKQLSLLPYRYELNEALGESVIWNETNRQNIPQLISKREVSAALCPSIMLLQDHTLDVALPYGVASHGATQTAYIVCKHGIEGYQEYYKLRMAELHERILVALKLHPKDPDIAMKNFWQQLEDITPFGLQVSPRIKITSQTNTEAQLAKIFLACVFGKQFLNIKNSDDTLAPSTPQLELLVGDQALHERCSYYKAYDLGLFWKRLTNKPFVYTIWQTIKEDLQPEFINKLATAAELAQSKMRINPTLYYPEPYPMTENGNDIDLNKCWKAVYYALGSEELEGLSLFLSLAKQSLTTPISDSASIRILKLHHLESSRI